MKTAGFGSWPPSCKGGRHGKWIGLVMLTLMGGGLLHRHVQSQTTDTPANHNLAQAVRVTVKTPTAGELERLVRQAAQAINARDGNALKPFVTPHALAAFDWMRSRTTKVWAGDVLIMPAALKSEAAQGNSVPASAPVSKALLANTTYLAVFHAWHTCESDGDHVHHLEATPDGWRLGEEIPETETGGYRVRDHTLNVTLNVAAQSASVEDLVKVEIVEKALLPVCLLRLSEDFHVDTISCDTIPVAFKQAGGILAVVPPTPDAAHAFTLALTYKGRVNHRGSDYILSEEATLDSYWYPHIARLPATATVTATAPPGWTPIAQGEKTQAKRNANGSLTVTYRNDIPTSYFTLDMGRYVITSRKVRGRLLSACLLTPDAERANRSLDVLEKALNFFDARFAPFPYTHYEIVETRGPFGGALEAYSFATFGPGTLPSVVVHELSHTWWGGLVPCTYTRSMWNESFAEYASSLFSRMNQEPMMPVEGAEEVPRRGQRRSFGAAFDAYTLEDASDTSDERQIAVGYGKGALVLRVLEEQIGADTMQRCLQTFIADHPRNEAAEWPEFARAVTKTTGQDYSWFFAQWTHRKGLPRVRLADVTSLRDGQGYIVQGSIIQDGAPYRLRMPVRVQTQDGKSVQQNLEVDSARTTFRIHANALPVRLTLDPDNLLPLATTTEQATTAL